MNIQQPVLVSCDWLSWPDSLSQRTLSNNEATAAMLVGQGELVKHPRLRETRRAGSAPNDATLSPPAPEMCKSHAASGVLFSSSLILISASCKRGDLCHGGGYIILSRPTATV